ncbi:MAG: MMPL family transporter [Acidobacteriota bacterium]
MGGRRWPILAITAAVAVVLMPGLARLETDNSPDVFIIEGNADHEEYQEFLSQFGHDHSLRIVFSGETLWTTEGLRFLDALERGAAELPGVVRASGLAEHKRRFGWPPADPQAFRRESIDNGLDRAAGWISRDGDAASCLLLLEALQPEQRRQLLDSLDSLLLTKPEGLEAQVLGLGVLNAALDRSSREIEERYFPLLIAFTVVLLAAVVRSPGQLIAALLFVGFCQLLTLGPMGYRGVALNMVLAILPPVIFVISLATAVHLILRVRYRASLVLKDGAEEAHWIDVTSAVFKEKGWAVLWTGVTTSVGFASLMVSDVAPVRSLGGWAALGLLLATVAAFTALPALVLWLRGKPTTASATGGFEGRASRWGATGAKFAVRNRPLVVGGLIAISGLAALGLPQLRVESNALHYLAPDHPLRAGIEEAESVGIGVAALELLVQTPSSGGGAPAPFVSALEVDRLADLASDLEKLEGITGVLNAGTVLRDALLYVPQTPTNAHLRGQMVLDGLAQDVQGREVLDSFLSKDRQTARSTVFVTTSGVEDLLRIESHLREQVAARFPEATARVTGEYRLLLLAQRSLISTLIFSLGLTLIAVAVVLRLLLPSFRLAFLALIPNLWPVVGGLGLMGWIGVPLDIATVMMASVVLGLAVDDTIHTLGHFRHYAPLHGAREAVVRTLRATAPAYLLTGAILMVGFGVCGLSDFAPIARFGALSAFSIGLAVLGDLFALPALLSLTPDNVCRRLQIESTAEALQRPPGPSSP